MPDISILPPCKDQGSSLIFMLGFLAFLKEFGVEA